MSIEVIPYRDTAGRLPGIVVVRQRTAALLCQLDRKERLYLKRPNNPAQACLDCMTACETCVACYLGSSEMANCLRLCIECAEICQACARVMVRGSQNMAQWCALCAEICEACAAECAKFDAEDCQQCAEACRRCASECRSMANAA